MFQARVSFRLLLNVSTSMFKDVIAVGKKCPTVREAETEAAAAALQELQSGALHMRVNDVSRIHCKDLEEKCYETLERVFEVYHGARSLLAAWENAMHKAEVCYSPMRRQTRGAGFAEAQNSHRHLSSDTADRLASLIRENYLRQQGLCAETEELKTCIHKTADRVRYLFHQPSMNQINEPRGNLPQEIELCMKLILEEMSISLRWDWPTYNLSYTKRRSYMCEARLLPNHVHTSAAPTPLAITGPEAASEEEAIQGSCKATILALEREKSIYLVDPNYNNRLHGELYVVEAKDIRRAELLVCSRTIAEWELMVHEIYTCVEYCEEQAMRHGRNKASAENKMFRNSSEAVAGLHTICQTDLEVAKQYLQSMGP